MAEDPTMTSLVFPQVERPTLSVVVVTYGGWRWVREALESLIEHTEPRYEVIVVDNASPDETPERLRGEVHGAKVVFNPGNLGFAAGVNRGVCYSTAPYLALLNSDAMVRPGWLPPLIEVLEDDPRAGAVVPMLVNLDGSLQEAGSLLGGDGTTMAWGAGGDATHLQYRFRRYVDYASAACLLMKRSTFLSVGGLDPRYPIGYYEDVDMCLALAERNLRVVYQPRSTVMHVRWGSSNVEEAGRLMHANRPILLRRWQHRLATRPSLVDWKVSTLPQRVAAARDAEALHRILVITNEMPDPSTRTGKLLAALADLWPTARITLIAANAAGTEDPVQGLLDHGIEVACGPEDWEAWLQARLFHYSAVLIGDAETRERFERPLEQHQPQALRVYAFGNAFQKGGPHIVDVGHVEAMRWADVVLCDSEEQRDVVAAIAPALTALFLPDETGPAPYRRAVVEAMAHMGLPPPNRREALDQQ
jgi:GT2 family glycosyltransferase